MHQNWILDFKSITFSHFYFSIFLSNTNTKGFSRWLNFIFLLRFDPHVGIWPPSFRAISRKCSKTLVLAWFLIKKWLVWQTTETDEHNANFFHSSTYVWKNKKKFQQCPSVPVRVFIKEKLFEFFSKSGFSCTKNGFWILKV